VADKGKRWRALRQKVDSQRRYTLEEAVGMIGELGTAKFDETVEVAIRLGVNPSHADQMVRGAVALPHGTGASVRVLVFAQGDAAKAAEEAGADFVGSDELITKIQQESWLDFDKAVATRDMMGKVGRIGRILGPRGLMPNPKVGTVVAPELISQTVTALKAGRIDFRVEKAGIVHAPVGRASFDGNKLEANIVALARELMRLKPATAKGTYIRSVALSTTMGVGVRVDPNDLARVVTVVR
jgi:large subunit ribosomal protein L1